MATTPDPIEGWTFTCEWRTDKQADGLKWVAHGQQVSQYADVWLESGKIAVRDTCGEYESVGSYDVPLAVIDALRKLAAEAEEPSRGSDNRLRLVHGVGRSGEAYGFVREDGSVFDLDDLIETDLDLLRSYAEHMLAAIYRDDIHNDRSRRVAEHRFNFKL